jgi:hypothetical protein
MRQNPMALASITSGMCARRFITLTSCFPKPSTRWQMQVRHRLRRWMEQSINVLRNAFGAFSDMHCAHFEAAPAASDATEIEEDLRILREWEIADAMPGIGQ